ncbi:hypothetical protein Pla110_25220 [Polystyrenella longa]|uniref:Thiol-disulfide oxidoreductase n=1 Tax=Polystyrenella longa TaxID=2528007 RepID=A0A518CNI8_9PLAN|nr:DUF393 domain-containing protein [Polystyrenella longa]QDU80787.1 hypothetical protein Pla110_25220 [Polystyrenella longa]
MNAKQRIESTPVQIDCKSSGSSDNPNTDHRLAIFYDGDCPLCRREIEMIQRKDKEEKLCFVNIAASEFKAEDFDKTRQQLMAELHARKANGEWIKGVEAFRQMYTLIGWKGIVRVSRLPIIEPLLNWAYRIFARNRLSLTGRRGACNEDLCQRD